MIQAIGTTNQHRIYHVLQIIFKHKYVEHFSLKKCRTQVTFACHNYEKKSCGLHIVYALAPSSKTFLIVKIKGFKHSKKNEATENRVQMNGQLVIYNFGIVRILFKFKLKNQVQDTLFKELFLLKFFFPTLDFNFRIQGLGIESP